MKLSVQISSRNVTAILAHSFACRICHMPKVEINFTTYLVTSFKSGIETDTKSYNGILISAVGYLTALSEARPQLRIVG
jgi:hypothetical protein